MKADIQIARESKIIKIQEIAKKLNINEDDLYLYGNYKAKININLLKTLPNKKGKLILVTAISPTPAGEGKTTTTVGLGDALHKLNKKPIICLREPSLGPVFGIKGGAAGGGYAQVIPMEDINLHFTGDLHAISATNNLLAALIDNHIFHGNELNIDPRKITWKRCLDMNDRQLRFITTGLGGSFNGTPREDGFDISVASEIMAVFCLAKNLDDLKIKLSKITVASTYENSPITVKDLNCVGALLVLLKDAFNPNLVQTLEQTPAIIHGGPFANIAHGCNSVVATNLSLKLGDYVITEAGFGADLGCEKFLDIKCRENNLQPDVVVIVATIRALKYHGNISVKDLVKKNHEALLNGYANLEKHIHNITKVYKLKVVVAINKFPSDSKEELDLIKKQLEKNNIDVAISEVFEKGSNGGIELATKVLNIIENENKLTFPYEINDTINDKITKLATKIYGANKIIITNKAQKKIDELMNRGFNNLPICVAKTQYSFSDDPKLLGAPKDFTFNINDVVLNSGAGFIVIIAGNIMRMPGLPKTPAANNIDLENDVITGLF